MKPLWIFGYGSLVWRPAFAFRQRQPACIRGWARRFWQGSTDHRGIPGTPGRVVTLVREPAATCWGMAYRIDPSTAESTLSSLDQREKGGYRRHRVELHLREAPAIEEGLVYVASEENPNYLGPAPLEQIAAQVLRSRGPSGPNLEYVLELAAALRDMQADDAHVFELAERVAALRQAGRPEGSSQGCGLILPR